MTSRPRADEQARVEGKSLLERATILHDDGTLQMASAGDVFVERWVQGGETEHLQMLRDRHLAYLQRGKGRWSSLLTVQAQPRPMLPNDAQRKLIMERIDKMEPHLAAAAVVIETPGFAASVVRGMVSAITLVRRTNHPFRIFATGDEGVQWLALQRNVPNDERDSPEVMLAWYRRLIAELTPAAR